MRAFSSSALALLLLVFSFARETLAEPTGPTQDDVQAVYLFNFAKFVRWPAGQQHETITICIAGPQQYVDTLSKIVAGEHVDSHALAVRAIQQPADEPGCDILYVESTAREHLDDLLAATAGTSILTVSDIPGFLNRGGMIQFLLVGNRVRFSVDLRPVTRSGLTLSSQLLKVAVAVTGSPSQGGTP